MLMPTPTNSLYLNRYIKLLRSVKPTTEYSETHHIIPKSLGGSDDTLNLIKLPSRVHFVAHWMLWKAYQTDELAYAFWAMCHQKKAGQEKRYSKINSKTYAILKELRSKTISNSNSQRWENAKWAENMCLTLSKAASTDSEKQRRSESLRKLNADKDFRTYIESKFKEKFEDPIWYKNYCDTRKQAASVKIKPILVDGIEYATAKDVSEKFSISISTVRQRINSQSKKFKGWNYKEAGL